MDHCRISSHQGRGSSISSAVAPARGSVRCITNAVAAGLDGVHVDVGQFVEYVWHLFKLWPVVLNVLPGGDVPVVFVVHPSYVAKLSQLVA